MEEETILANDLRATLTETHSGFVYVDLYDADDHEKFQLGEDEILSLYKYLGKVITEKKLG